MHWFIYLYTHTFNTHLKEHIILNIENGIPLDSNKTCHFFFSTIIFLGPITFMDTEVGTSKLVRMSSQIMAFLAEVPHKGFLHVPLFVVSWVNWVTPATRSWSFLPMLVGSWVPPTKKMQRQLCLGWHQSCRTCRAKPLSSRAPRFAQQWLLPMGCSKRPGIYQPIKSGSLTKTRSSLICDMCIWLYVYADTESSWNDPRWFKWYFK